MRRMRRAVALAVLCVALLTLGAGAVWAVTLIDCPNVPGTDRCLGTSGDDIIIGTSASGSIAGLAGRDRINDSAKQDIDTISGGADNDTIDVREGNVGLNNHDLVDCGAGERDRVFFDKGEGATRSSGAR
jgi:Ca2+-binding RTX toxin-like protein